MERRAVLLRGRGPMPDGLFRVVLIGFIGFFIGAVLVGWMYG
jgi:hypothetical protein